MRYVRRRHHLVIGEANAERIKIEAGHGAGASRTGARVEIHIKGPRPARGPQQRARCLARRTWPKRLSGCIGDMAEFHPARALEDLPGRGPRSR